MEKDIFMNKEKTKVIALRVPVSFLNKAEESGFSVMEALRAYIIKLTKSKKCPTCGVEKVKK